MYRGRKNSCVGQPVDAAIGIRSMERHHERQMAVYRCSLRDASASGDGKVSGYSRTRFNEVR